MQHLLFVYGTLKKKFPNHHYLSDAVYKGQARTEKRYALFESGALPFACKMPEIAPVQGELYKIDDNTLKRIDKLEGHPIFYKREQVPIICGEKTVMAWMYFSLKPRGKLCCIQNTVGVFEFA